MHDSPRSTLPPLDDVSSEDTPLPCFPQLPTIDDLGEAAAVLGLAPPPPEVVQAAADWPVVIPESMVGRLRRDGPVGPLVRQFFPDSDELRSEAGFLPDPLGEAPATRHGCMLQKYQGRALILATSRCGARCRFCFRRHLPTPRGDAITPAQLRTCLQAMAADRTFREVILSGGDPWMLSDEGLTTLLAQLLEISHLRRFRFHTRMPVVVPQRITEDLIALLREVIARRRAVVVVVHVNHVDELSPEVRDVLARLLDAGIPVLSQTVLLAGVNDQPDTLGELFETLGDQRVMPYYLHQLDPVAGTAHFHVPLGQGRAIVDAVRARLPGYLVPRFVQERHGAAFKVPVG